MSDEYRFTSEFSDRELGMDRKISRRDFLDGMAVTVGALGAAGLAGTGTAQAHWGHGGGDRAGYPPRRTRLRGSHEGSYEVAHAVRDGDFWRRAGRPRETGERYDLVVVGAGISGLSAAYLFLRDVDPRARILIVDPHDDFGGHAKRNEFVVDGRLLISNGGSSTIDNPRDWAGPLAPSKQLIDEIGVDLDALAASGVANHYASHGAGGSATLFLRDVWGRDHLVVNQGLAATLADAPLAPEAKAQLVQLLTDPPDWLAGSSQEQKIAELSKRTCAQMLTEYGNVHPDVLKYLNQSIGGAYGMFYEHFGALEGVSQGVAGLTGIEMDFSAPWPGLSRTAHLRWYATDRTYTFPDGNAGIARLLVRKLIPNAIPGSTTADLTLAACDYDRLDRARNHVRIRLGATAVRVRHDGGRPDRAKHVDVDYVQCGRLYRVRTRAVVMACWNAMVPFIAPDFPATQQTALREAVKSPLNYTRVALRNWEAWQQLGISRVSYPGGYWGSLALAAPRRIGGYDSATTPSQPVLVTATKAALKPGLPFKESARAGRAEVARTSFADYERRLRDQLLRALGGAGFNPARDIAAITVNRWPHGYMRVYNVPYDASFWPQGPTPAEIGTRPVGRITVASTDAGNHGFFESSIETAHAAVQYLKGVSTLSDPRCDRRPGPRGPGAPYGVRGRRPCGRARGRRGPRRSATAPAPTCGASGRPREGR